MSNFRLRSLLVLAVAMCAVVAIAVPATARTLAVSAPPALSAQACLLPNNLGAAPQGISANYTAWSTCDSTVQAPGCDPQSAPPFNLDVELNSGTKNNLKFDYANIKSNFPQLGIYCIGGALTGYFQATPLADTGTATGDFNASTGKSSVAWGISATAHIKGSGHEGDCIYENVHNFVLTTDPVKQRWTTATAKHFKSGSGTWVANNFTLDPSVPGNPGDPDNVKLCKALDQIIFADGKSISTVSFALGVNMEKK